MDLFDEKINLSRLPFVKRLKFSNMQLRTLLTLAIYFIFSHSPFAQTEVFIPASTNWGEIPREHLTMTSYPYDSTANALVLADIGEIEVHWDYTDDPYLFRKVHQRIKLLKESALDQFGDVELYYYHHNNIESIQEIRAQTVSPQGRVTVLDNDEVFFDRVDDNYTRVSFSLPNVEVGSIIEYTYVRKSKEVIFMSPWYFQTNVPVLLSEVQVSILTSLTYTYLFTGLEFMDANEVEGVEIYRNGPTEFRIDGSTFTLKHGQALRDEPFITTLEDYGVNVRLQCSEYQTYHGVTETVLSTWQEAASQLLERDDLGRCLAKRSKYNEIVDASEGVIDPDTAPEEIIEQIRRFITTEVRWSGREGITTNVPLETAYERHEGNLSEIQLMGIALLRHYGIKANPVLVSTRDNGAMIEQFPFIRQYNYMIIAVEYDDQFQLLDFSDPLFKPGLVRIRALNHAGFFLDEESPGVIKFEAPIFQDQHAFALDIDEEGSISGRMRCQMTGYSALNEREASKTESIENIWINRLGQAGMVSIHQIESVNEENISEPYKVNASFSMSGTAFSNGDFLYFSPIIYSNFIENPFQQESRNLPVDFPYPFAEKLIYQFNVPEGFAIESIPESITLDLPNEGGVFEYAIRQANEDLVVVNSILRLQQTFFSPAEYPALRDFFAAVSQKFEEQFVLKRLN